MPTENKIRLTAFLVFILTIIYIKTNFIFIPFFLLIDFAIRGFGFGKWSILGLIAEKLVSILKLEQKPIYFPPKQFAAQVGFIFSLLLLVFHIAEINSIIIKHYFTNLRWSGSVFQFLCWMLCIQCLLPHQK